MTIIKHKPSEWSNATVLSVWNQLATRAPMARVRVVIPEGGATLSSYCDDQPYFPDYNASEWSDDFEAYLTSLGAFEVNWGDGNTDVFIYNDGYSGNGFTHTYTEGTYILTWKSSRVFISSEYVTEIVSLKNLQTLSLSDCTSLTTPPDLTGLTALQYLDLGNCTSLDLTDIDTVLGYFATLYSSCTTADLRNGVTPTPSIKSAAQAANPQCIFYTN